MENGVESGYQKKLRKTEQHQQHCVHKRFRDMVHILLSKLNRKDTLASCVSAKLYVEMIS